MNLNTLIPADQWTDEQRRERGRKGAQKANEVRRQRKQMRESVNVILAMPLRSVKEIELVDVAEIKSLAEAKGLNITVQDAIILKQVQLALAGSTKAFELLRDTAGEKPKEQIETQNATLDRLDEILENIGGVI